MEVIGDALEYVERQIPSSASHYAVSYSSVASRHYSLLQFKVYHIPKRSHIIQLRLILLRLETDNTFSNPHPDRTNHQPHPSPSRKGSPHLITQYSLCLNLRRYAISVDLDDP
jgi:hypothetical protein